MKKKSALELYIFFDNEFSHRFTQWPFLPLFDLLHTWFSNRVNPCWMWSWYPLCRISLSKHRLILESVLFLDDRIPKLWKHAILHSSWTRVTILENWVNMFDAEICLVGRPWCRYERKCLRLKFFFFYLLWIYYVFTLFVCFVALDTLNEKKCTYSAILGNTGIRKATRQLSYS